MPECQISRNACKHLRDGHAEDALLHARRALGIAPKNPFYLSYTGLLAALAEQRFGDAEMLCQEAIGMRHNHAQLYLNLAEVYQKAGRTQEAIEVLEKGLVSAGRDFGFAAHWKKSARGASLCSVPAPQPPVNRTLGKWRHRLTGLAPN